jgi:thiopeptide-type bacteriocin biosynthesis protein
MGNATGRDGGELTVILSSQSGWRGVHLFFPAPLHGPWADQVLFDVVEPFVRRCQTEGWIDKWFFIRYHERGPHLRLRLHGSLALLGGTVAPAFEQMLRDRDPRVAEGLADLDDEWGESNAADVSRHPVSHYAWVEYEPEFQRYGGVEPIAVAEELFHRSSEFVLRSLRALPSEGHAQRLGRGLLAFLVVAHTFLGGRENVSLFARAYGSNYLRSLRPDEDGRSRMLMDFDGGFERQSSGLSAYVEDAWSRLTDGAELTADLDEFRAHVTEARDDFRGLVDRGCVISSGQIAQSYIAAARSIVPSYIHMTNNRLGISVADEAYLAHLIRRTLSAPAEAEAGIPGSETE